MTRNKLHLAILAFSASFSAIAQTNLAPLTINVDENTKTNTTIGEVRFVNGEADTTVTVEIGKTQLTNWATNGEEFEPISFSPSFSEAVLTSSSFSGEPIIFGQIQSASQYQIAYTIDTYSYSGGVSRSGQEFIMRHRFKDATTTGFNAILESELDKRGTSVVQSIDSTGSGETLGWLAFSGPVNGVMYDKQLEVMASGTTVNHNEYGQSFAAPFSDIPNVITSISTYNGQSQSGVTITDLNSNRAKVFVDNIDDEQHNAENVNFIAVEDEAFFLTASSAIFGEAGKVVVNDTGKDEPFMVILNKQYNDPVVFVQAVGKDETIYDATVRIMDITNNSFSAYLHSAAESVLPAGFGEFELHYQVFETGTWEIPLEHYSYEITAGNDTGAFLVDPVTGKIKVADQTQLDFESGNNQFAFTLTVTDGHGNTYDTQVTINVEDINDSLNNTAQIIEGLNAEDWSGWSVAPAGDVNGDGFDDIIVGVPQDDTLGADAGAVYVLFSDASGQLPSLTDVRSGNRGFAILGAADGDNAGFAVAGGVDINGDGLTDIVVGAPYADVNGKESGSVYVVFGKTDTNYIDLANFEVSGGDKGYAMHGAYTEDYAGGTLAVGDVNGDGLADVIIGETVTRFLAGTGSFELRDLLEDGSADPNMAYVVYGKTSGAALNLAQVALDDNPAGFTVSRESRKLFGSWHYGAQVLPTGDFNSDGLTDFIVSNGLYGDNWGTSFVVYGRVGGTSVNYNSIRRDGNGIKINPENGNYGFDFGRAELNALPSFTTSNVGDVNADGVDDVALLLTDAGCCSSINHPRAYIIFGGVNLDDEINLADIANGVGGFVINNDASNVNHHDLMVIIGSIGGAGDLNGDGYDDIIIGDPFAEDGKGRVYAVYGQAGNQAINLSEIIETEKGFYSEGNGGEQLGQFIASAGDINGDGIKDIQFGTPSANTNNLNNNGAVYVLKGDGNLINHWGTTGNDNLAGTTNGETFAAGLGDDVVLTNGGADAVYTGPGKDVIVIKDTNFIRIDGGGDEDTLMFDGAGITLNLAAASSKVRSIEVFDISGSGANTLAINKSVSSNSSIRILGDADDSVKAANNQWTDTGTVVVIDNVEYGIFRVGAAEMLVQTGVSVEINNEPTIEAQSYAVSEYSAGGTVLGTVLADANDVGDHVVYSILSGNDNNSFVINSTTGELSINTAISRLDYETQNTFALQVQVTDTYGAIDQATITVNVNDVEYITHSFAADLSATESTFGSTAFTDILHVATMNEIAGKQLSTGDIPEANAPDLPLPPGFSHVNPADWQKTIDNMSGSAGEIFDFNINGHFFFEPRFSMQTGQVVSDIPVTMDLAYADEVQVGQETLITSQVQLDNYAGFTATSPAFDLNFALGVTDFRFRLQSPVILDKNNDPLDKQTSLDGGSFEFGIKSSEIAVAGRHCINTIGQPACHISAESDHEQPLRISASIETDKWFEQELFYKTSWKAWYYGASGQAINHQVRECREDFFYPAGEDLYYDYNFEMMDTFLSVYGDVKQDFYLEVRPVSRLTLEDGSVLIFKGDEDISFTPELHHDVNNDGVIDANLTVNLYSVFYNDTKTSIGARLPFQMGLAEWNIQEALCTADNIYLFQQSGMMYEKGQFGPALDFEFGFEVEEISLTEWKWDEAAETLASPFIKKSESTEPLPPYLYNDNEWLLAHETFSKNISFDLCNQGGVCGEPVLSYHNNAPKVTDVTVSGEFVAKNTVSASYVYSDYENDLEVGSIYQWFIASNSEGNNAQAIEGEVYASYPLAVQDIGKHVQFCVKPYDGENYGTEQCSAWHKVTSPFYKDFSITTGFGNAIELNGVDQSLYQNTAHTFDPGTDSFTFEMWIKVEQFNTDKPINVLTFNSGSSRAALRIMPDGRLRSKSTDTTYFSTETVSLNTWQHIAIAYDQDTSQLTIYLDGEVVISQTDTSFSRDVNLVWGANGGQDDRFLTGRLDELRFWNVARTQTEIQANRWLSLDPYEPNLVSYYTFDNDTVDAFTDLTGNTDMSATNGANFVAHNTYLSLDGDGDYFNVGYSSTDLNWGGESFTAQAWIYLDAGTRNTTHLIMSKRLSGASGHNGWSLKVNSANQLLIHLKPVGGEQTLQTPSSYDLKTERWYHVAVTVDRENKKLKLYQNGVLATQANLSNKTNINSASPLRFGAFSGTNVTNNNFEGDMDNVAIWNRVLSQDEIQACMNGLALGCEESLFLYYDFEDSSGKNKAQDRFGGGAKGDAAYVAEGLDLAFTTKVTESFTGTLPMNNGVAVSIAVPPSHGEVTVDEATGTFTYTPDGNAQVMSDSFSYVIYDVNDGYSFKRIVSVTREQ